MEKVKDYYAIIDSIKPGLFSNQRTITVGGDEREILVDFRSLAKTKDNLTAVRFYEESRERGMSIGYVENCDQGATPDKRRSIPLDSLVDAREVIELKK
jgi:hypothetical protein